MAEQKDGEDAIRAAAIRAVHRLEAQFADPSVEQYVDAVLSAVSPRTRQTAAEQQEAKAHVVTVRRSQVYAARTRLSLDRQDDRRSPKWVVKLAAVDLTSPPVEN